MNLMETGGGFGLGEYGEGSGGSASSSAESGAVKRSSLPFNSAAAVTATAALADTLFLSASSSLPGGMMGNSRTAFTLAQREELKKQTLIFEYMAASIPVPPQLLLPQKSITIVGSTRISCSSSSDPEPWRCKKMDGKKWRCSHDVAPYQKYCERHSYKNRPRSRKPVEFISNNTANKLPVQPTQSSFSSPYTSRQESLSHLVPYHIHKEFSHAAGSATPRCLKCLKAGEVISVPNSDRLVWHHSPLEQQQHHLGSLSTYWPGQELQALTRGHVSDQCSLLLGMTSLEDRNLPKGSSFLSKRMPTSSPSLVMSAGGEVGEEDDERESLGQMGLGSGHDTVTSGWDCDRRAESKPHWMSPGGPLAEALCLGTSSIGKSPPSDQT